MADDERKLQEDVEQAERDEDERDEDEVELHGQKGVPGGAVVSIPTQPPT